MYEELVNRLKNLATLVVRNGGSDLCVSAEAAEATREIAQEAANAIEELSKRVPKTPHGRLIDADAFIKEINDRIEAAIKWGVNAIADGNAEIKTRAEQAVATFCEASLTAKKIPTIIEAEGEGDDEKID